MRKFIIAAVAAVALPVSAQAADLPVKARSPAVVVATSWTGFYAGGSLGYASVGGKQYDFDTNYHDAIANDGERGAGGYVGFNLGYDWQTGQFVIGVNIESKVLWTETSIRQDRTDITQGIGHTGIGLGSATARVGFLATQQTLLYASGGGAWGIFKTHHWDSNEYDGTHRLFYGWTAGGGIEHKFTNNVSLVIDGKYYQFSQKSWRDNADEPFGLRPNVWTVGIGMNYRLN
ncbi:MAG: outer membrane beta-barrel protein [Xanthobacteraceae bacterium]|nr:outer membrane beta-barrel protein [Xanthobacteraceae bacterium]